MICIKSVKKSPLLLVVIASLLLPLSAYAAPPSTMTYQGRLTDRAGKPVEDTLEMSFRVFEAETGGQALWSDRYESIDINDGSFSVQLDFKDRVQELFDGRKLWLEVKIGDDILHPRSPVESVPYAFYAENAFSAKSLDDSSYNNLVEEAARQALRTPIEGVEIEEGGSDLTEVINHLLTRISTLEDQLNGQPGSGSDGSGSGEITARLQQIEENLWGSSRSPNSAPPGGGHDDEQCGYLREDRGLTGSVQALECLTSTMTLMKINEKTSLVFEKVNIHLRDGQNPIDLNEPNNPNPVWNTPNGFGNLIVGYDEYNPAGGVKTGSHNIVVGPGHSYSSVGGFVAGAVNSISAPGTTVSGGMLNQATSTYSSVSGGRENKASGLYSSVSGGTEGVAAGNSSSVSGGSRNVASGNSSSVSGGQLNRASNTMTSITGGRENKASGHTSSVSGGNSNEATNTYSSVSGGQSNEASGQYSSVSGGRSNTAAGGGSSVSGGSGIMLNDDEDWGPGS